MGYKINTYESGKINILCGNVSCNNINITISPIYVDNNNKIELFTTQNIIEYIIIISVILICFMNIICCFYWICYKHNHHKQHIKRKQHSQHIETLKPPNITNNNLNTNLDNDLDDILDNSLDNNLDNNSDNNNNETVDLENAPMLDLSDLDESESFNNIKRKNPDITFWNEQPGSPKKQDNINDEKHNFEDENNDKKEEKDLSEIKAPDITNMDANLPIPPKFDVNFKFLNPTNEPSHVSVITPRNLNNDKKLTFTKEINENQLKNDNQLFLTAPKQTNINEINSQKNKNGKTGKYLKDKSREFISKEDIYQDLNNLTDEKSPIVKFNVNSNNKLPTFLENKEISNKYKHHQKHYNINHFKIEMPMEMDIIPSPKSKSKSKTISPRNLIDKIRKLSPRNNSDNSKDKKIHQLLIPPNISMDYNDDDDNYYNHDDDDDENTYLSNKIICDNDYT